MNEEAEIDSFKITLIQFQNINPQDANISLVNDVLIKYTFRIKNLSNEKVELESERFFKLQNENDKLIGDHGKTEIEPKETIDYVVLCDVSKSNLYPVLFYSGTVDNNIEFVGEI